MDGGDIVNTGSSCSPGVEDDDDSRSESPSFYGDSDHSNSILSSDIPADDATYSSPSSSSLSSFDLSSIGAELPVKRGLSRYFEGKSKSFRSLSDVRSLEDLVKQKIPIIKRLKTSGDYGLTQNRCNKPIFHGRTISKRTTSKGSSVFWQARRNRNGGLPSSKKNAQPASAREPAVPKM